MGITDGSLVKSAISNNTTFFDYSKVYIGCDNSSGSRNVFTDGGRVCLYRSLTKTWCKKV